MKKLIIFDVDGTLYRANLVSFPAYKILAEEMGFAAPSEELISTFFGETFEYVGNVLGLSSDKAVRENFEKRIEQLEFDCLKKYGAMFEGVYAQLARLHEEGFLLALCSMGVKSYVEGVMEYSDIGRFITTYRFDNGVDDKSQMAGDILAEIKPDRAIFVGDRKHDLGAAVDNGIGFVGCDYGFAPHEVAAAEIIAKEPHELYDAIIKAFE